MDLPLLRTAPCALVFVRPPRPVKSSSRRICTHTNSRQITDVQNSYAETAFKPSRLLTFPTGVPRQVPRSPVVTFRVRIFGQGRAAAPRAGGSFTFSYPWEIRPCSPQRPQRLIVLTDEHHVPSVVAPWSGVLRFGSELAGKMHHHCRAVEAAALGPDERPLRARRYWWRWTSRRLRVPRVPRLV